MSGSLSRGVSVRKSNAMLILCVLPWTPSWIARDTISRVAEPESLLQPNAKAHLRVSQIIASGASLRKSPVCCIASLARGLARQCLCVAARPNDLPPVLRLVLGKVMDHPLGRHPPRLERHRARPT